MASLEIHDAPLGVRRGSRPAWFLAGMAALLVPLWIVRYPPLLDYPNHLASSFVLAHLHDPRFHFDRWYAANWTFSPYVFTDAVLVMLQRIMSVEVAGRIVLSIYIVTLPLAVWFFARQIRTGVDLAVLAGFILAYDIFFLAGFVQYCLGISACFAVLGLWLRYLSRPSMSRWIGLLITILGLYSVHLFGFAAAGLVIGVYGFVKRLRLAQQALSWLLFAPGVALMLSSEIGVREPQEIVFGSLLRKAGWFLALFAVEPRPAGPRNLALFALLGMLAVIGLHRRAYLRWNGDWVKVAVVLFGFYCLLPGAYNFQGNVVQLDARLLPVLLIVTVAAVEVERRARWIAVVTIAIFLVRMASLTDYFVVEQLQLGGLARSIQVVPSNARVLPMWAIESGRFNQLAFEPNHFWSYGVMRRGWLSPYLFSTGAHPLRLLSNHAYPSWGQWAPLYESGLDWERVRVGYDYVWAYQLPHLSTKLQTIGDLIFVGGGLEVYRLRTAPVGPSNSLTRGSQPSAPMPVR